MTKNHEKLPSMQRFYCFSEIEYGLQNDGLIIQRNQWILQTFNLKGDDSCEEVTNYKEYNGKTAGQLKWVNLQY